MPSEPEKIPLFDLQLGEREIEAATEALRSGWLTMGPRTESFERAFAEHLGCEHAVALSSCTSALHLAYLAAGVGPGDEVIVPAITFVATANAVRYCGATPVFADVCGQHDLGIDPDDLERRITPATKAVCAMHYAGYPADLERIGSICERRGIALIEDAAHAPSSTQVGSERKLGTFGLAGAFSFFSNKVLSCGEGGLLATDDDEVAALARSRRSHAMTHGTWDRHRGHAASYDVVGLGFNYRIDEPRAALLEARLEGLEGDIARRREHVHAYREALASLDGIAVPYRDAEVAVSSCYTMPTLLEDPQLRDPLREAMAKRGIQTSVLYPAVHEFTAYAQAQREPLPRSERAARTQLTLPLYPALSTEDRERVVEAIANGLAELDGQEAGA